MAVEEFRDGGYLPEAVLNYLALLGWGPGDEQEVFDREELVARFDLDHVTHSAAVFDHKKLDWINGEWIRRLPDDELVQRTLPFLDRSVAAAVSAGAVVRTPDAQALTDLLPLVRERLPRLDAIGPLVDFVFLEDIVVDPTLLVPKRWDAATTSEGLLAARSAIAALGEVSF